MNSSKNGKRILCVGEAMAELMLGDSEDTPPGLGFAGDTMNTAIYLKRLLGDNANLSYVTVLGQDTLSTRLLRRLEAESIDTALIKHSDEKNIGLYAITTDKSGERSFNYWRNDSAARLLFQDDNDFDFSSLAGADVVYFSAITLAILPPAVREALLAELNNLRTSCGLTVVFDSNYRPALWESEEQAQRVVAAAWRITDIALPSVDDEQMLFKDTDESSVFERLQSYGITRGALKRGELGPVSLDASIEVAQREMTGIDNSSVRVVDTTAAGDSFNAGYLSAVLSGADEHTALRAGHDCSVRVIGHSGAIIPLELWG